MRAGKTLAAALIAAAVGGFVSGCFLFPGEDPTLARLCASPSEGGEYCVSSDRGPGSAWESAKANGSLPIQMWAERPEAVTLDDLVRSRSKLDAWFADIDRVVFYLRETAQSAESYQASMDGRLGALLREANRRQRELMAERPVDAIGHFKAALGEKANEEKEPLVAEIASDKQSMGAAREVLDEATEEASPLGAAYGELVAEFSSYRASEEDETKAYVELGDAASATTLDTIDGVEQETFA
jgi:hypothetical protein